MTEDSESDTNDTNRETVTGEVVATRTVETQDSDFRRAALNKLSFRNLEGGTYKLVRVAEDEADHDE